MEGESTMEIERIANALINSWSLESNLIQNGVRIIQPRVNVGLLH